MDTILLQQHFFGSVPAGHGLTGNRGFQSIGRSAGSGEERLLEEHCDYEPPEDHTGGPLPVNWGWFELNDGRACLHRIGDAGTDEIGRTGNFLAHNLVTSAGELDAIDYDIPALFRWVAERSPIRYPSDAGGDDGFASYPWQVNERFGMQPALLRAIPPLEVPIAEVRAIRERMDRQLGPETVTPLRASLAPDGVGALLSAMICPRETRRPTVVSGLRAGPEFAAVQRRIVELLFALLPYHCRSRLTYATYFYRLPGADDLSPSAPMHRRRRLVVTATRQDPTTTGGRNSGTFWIVGANGVRHQVPSPPDRLARRYEEWLERDSGLSPVFASRSVAGHFAFDDELQGLQDGWRWAAIREGSDYTPREIELFARTAPFIRDAWPEIVEVGIRVVDALQRQPELADQLLPRVVSAYLRGVGRVHPAMPPGLREVYSESISDDLAVMLALSIARQKWESVRELIAGIGVGPAFAGIRTRALDALSRTLEERLPGDDLDRLAAAWTAVSAGCAPGAADPEVLAFRARAASHLMALFLRGGSRRGSDQLAAVRDTLVLPVLVEAPFSAPQELLDRFAFLEHVPGEDRAGCCSRFIVELSRAGKLSPAVLEQVASDQRSLVLRFLDAWEEAARLAPAALSPIQRLTDDPELVAAYWRTPAEERGSLMDHGLVILLRDHRESAQAEWAHQLAQLYAREGGATLLRDIEEDDRRQTPRSLANTADAHCELLEAVLAGRRGAEDPPLSVHLSRLFAHLLTAPLAGTCDPRTIGAMLGKPVEVVLKWYPDVATRASFFERVAWSVLRICCKSPSRGDGTSPRWIGFRDALRVAGISPAEARWHEERFRLATRPVGDGQADETMRRSISASAAANLLLEFPGLTAGDPQGEFEQYFGGRLDEAVWSLLKRRLVDDCTGPDRELGLWFGAGGPLAVLTDQLGREGWLAKAGQELTGRLAGHRRVTDSILALEELLALKPHEAVAEPARLHLSALVTRWIDAFGPSASARCDTKLTPSAARSDFSICHAVLRVEAELDRERLERVWARLGDCLALLERPGIERFFPTVFALGHRLTNRLGAEYSVWVRLFEPTFRSGKLSRSLDIFVACGDSLHVSPADILDTVSGVEELGELHHDSVFRERLYADYKITDYMVSDYTETELFKALSRAPGNGKFFESIYTIAGRARLGALLYCPGHYSALASLYHQFGPIEGEYRKTACTAAALWGFLTARGKGPAELKAQLALLFDKRFWKDFKDGCNTAERQDLCDDLERFLRRDGVDEKLASQATDQVRRSMQGWIRRHFGRQRRRTGRRR